MKYYFLILTFCLIAFLGSCKINKQTSPSYTGGQQKNTAQNIENSLNIQEEKTNTITEKNTNIKKNAESIIMNAEESNVSADKIKNTTTDKNILTSTDDIIKRNNEIKERSSNILQSTEIIQINTSDLLKHTDIIRKDAKTVSILQQRIVELENKSKEIQQNAIKDLYTTLSFFFGLGFLTIIAGIVLAFLVNRKLGYSIAGIGLLALALAAGAIYYMQAIAIVAISIIIGGIVLCVGIGIWMVVKENKEKVVFEKANEENVQLVQTIKQQLDEGTKIQIFGETKPGIVDKIQSAKTKEIVKKAKNKIKGNQQNA